MHSEAGVSLFVSRTGSAIEIIDRELDYPLKSNIRMSRDELKTLALLFERAKDDIINL